jgi:AcrR family transcriptional regulator
MTGDGMATAGRRAERVAQTRRRIVEATVELHTTVGPARTSISAIAERAGVQRHTVYAHFPDQRALLAACTALWDARNPFPDVGRWATIADPRERLAVALDEVYRYYGSGAGDDLAAVFAGAELLPEMAESRERMDAAVAGMARLLARGRGARGRRRTRLLAVIEHALRLETWRALGPGAGLTRDETVALMTALADAACAAEPPAVSPPSAGAAPRPRRGGSSPRGRRRTR